MTLDFQISKVKKSNNTKPADYNFFGSKIVEDKNNLNDFIYEIEGDLHQVLDKNLNQNLEGKGFKMSFKSKESSETEVEIERPGLVINIIFMINTLLQTSLKIYLYKVFRHDHSDSEHVSFFLH